MRATCACSPTDGTENRIRLDYEDELRDGNRVRGARHIAPLGEGTPAVDT